MERAEVALHKAVVEQGLTPEDMESFISPAAGPRFEPRRQPAAARPEQGEAAAPNEGQEDREDSLRFTEEDDSFVEVNSQTENRWTAAQWQAWEQEWNNWGYGGIGENQNQDFWGAMPTAWDTLQPERSVKLMPEFLKAWFLLMKTGLDHGERQTVTGALKVYGLSAMEAKLRELWPEDDLRRRDSDKWRNQEFSLFGGEQDSEEDEGNIVEVDTATLNDEGVALWA